MSCSILGISVRPLLLGVALLLAACAGLRPVAPAIPPFAYTASGADESIARYAPVLVPATGASYNRIGTPAARLDAQGREEIYVDPDRPTLYAERRTFETTRGRYTNYLYRVHFEQVPVRLLPFNLTAGRNGGLFVVVTVNARDEPVLVTTVHSCGCYLAFVPTTYLALDAYPAGWNVDTQDVFGETLPGRLVYPPRFDAQWRPVVFLRDQTHRVMDIQLRETRELATQFRPVHAPLAAMESLKHLPLGVGTTSFYENDGPRRGYVKGTYKPFEALLMSWWALDPHVGVDKELGDPRETGTVFYTSLKPWHRTASDMWNFAEFLRFWGWRL